MVIALRGFEDLDPDLVQQNQDEVTARIKEDNPTLYLKQGPFFGMLVYYHSLLSTRDQQNLVDYLNARSLSVMNADPVSALPELVDEAASNYRVSRLIGTRATGQVKIVVSDNISVVIGTGAEFQAAGKLYLTEQVFSAKLEPEQILDSGDRLLTEQDDGNWAFTIDVFASNPGEAYRLKKDTVIVPLIPPNRYVTSVAASDFVDGDATQSNEELLSRLQPGMAAQTVGNRVNNLALLTGDPAFERIIGMSIVGLGDAELTRDRPTIFPIKLGGRSDWYVRTREEAMQVGTSKTAVLIEKLLDGTGIWQMTFDREESAGIYEIISIRPPNTEATGGYEVVADVRSIDQTGDGFMPDLPTAEHAAYSAYQTITIQFHDDQTVVTDLELLSTATYECARHGLPQIAEIQAKLNDYDVRYTGADCLIKAPIPCFVSINLTIVKQSGTDDPDTASIQDAIVQEINRIGFTGRLYASQIHDVVHGYLSGAMGVSGLDLIGRLRYPNGTTKYLSAKDSLRIVAEEERMVSSRTVQFFATAADILVAVETSVPLNI